MHLFGCGLSLLSSVEKVRTALGQKNLKGKNPKLFLFDM